MIPIQEYGPAISLAVAKQVVARAEAAAQENGWAMVIAVVDSSGHLVLLHRMDHAQYGSIAVAQAKAATAINFKRPSRVFEDAVAAGGIGLRLLAMNNQCCPLEGGIPLQFDGRIVGAIGVSGAQSAQDGVVAAAGAAVVEGGLGIGR